MWVFLFGSYDSRGGTTAIAAPDREAAYADAIYRSELGLDDAKQRELVASADISALTAGLHGVTTTIQAYPTWARSRARFGVPVFACASVAG